VVEIMDVRILTPGGGGGQDLMGVTCSGKERVKTV
jgi:hypothetical protein